MVGGCQPFGTADRTAFDDRAWKARVRCEREDTYGQIIGGGMESDGGAMGGSAADNYAVDPLFSGNYGLDEAYDHDLLKTDGG